MTWVPARSGLVNFYYTEVQKRQLLYLFPNEAYNNLIASFKNLPSGLTRDDSDQTLPVCWRADFPVRSVKDVKRFFKPLTLQFRKRWWVMPTTFTIPPEGYLLISGEGNVCLGILNGMEIHHGSTIIIGDVSLRGKLVVYDNVQNKIGWARSDCAKPQKTSSFPFFF
uniref:Peptidase A1 domain-containing protein n=1 Tax=Ananas comosus var. bracteatus TaxID=296719 RepID=A0A6V7P771_ANACO|nr:unnamed protein product [Ananas comosus var. bracteatus]